MKAEEIREFALHALEDLKGIDIVDIDIREQTTIADYMLICTGRSTTHLKALAENLVQIAKEKNLSRIRMEGKRDAEWIVVDLGDVIVHVMLPQTRSFYSLEDLWEPVKELREIKRGT